MGLRTVVGKGDAPSDDDDDARGGGGGGSGCPAPACCPLGRGRSNRRRRRRPRPPPPSPPPRRRGERKDESFFEARPWFDSDSEDDFHSVRGDFTPSRGSTPDHPKATFFSGRMPVDRLKPPVIQKKQRLLDLLQEKQHYDDDDDSVTDVSSELEDGAVHAEEHMKTSRSRKKSERTSRSGCFPSLVWKHRFTNYRKKRKEHKDK
ncbi:hypothetical protein U9M48_032203 [Paspalum notatum var. saurae]|uniref:Uncharacterized protein n=1 Tax=Paspalum notatum var. saurae TaxID=547442 RepID=A0AAQ3X578_PASNO